MSITDTIKPIVLLKGSHADTATTGQGCMLNVVAYLNGESQITDESPCVCFMVRPMCIKLNDLSTDEQRQRLIPFIERAMGSATKDPAVIAERKRLIRQYGAECQAAIYEWREALKKRGVYVNAYANAYAYAYANAYVYADAYAYAYAAAYAAAYAYADADANASAYAYANAYADAYALKDKLFDAGMRFLDAALPQAQPISAVVAERACRLVELAA